MRWSCHTLCQEAPSAPNSHGSGATFSRRHLNPLPLEDLQSNCLHMCQHEAAVSIHSVTQQQRWTAASPT